MLIPRARFYSRCRLPSRPIDKNNRCSFTGRHRPVLTFCLGVVLKLAACIDLLQICWLQRNLQRTWDRYCNRVSFPCQGSFNELLSNLVLGFYGSAFLGKTTLQHAQRGVIILPAGFVSRVNQYQFTLFCRAFFPLTTAGTSTDGRS